MAQPSDKSPAMDALLDEITGNVFGRLRSEVIKQNTCVICKGDASEFSDALSEREYRISGMCQKCQDLTFG